MSASLSGVYNLQVMTNTGAPAALYRLYTYAQGTTTHKVAYTDAAGAVPHTYTSDGLGGQYIALNARGELPAPLFLTPGPYDLALKDASGASVWTRYARGQDDAGAAVRAAILADLADTADPAKGPSLVGYKSPKAGSVARTVYARLTDFQSVNDFLGPVDTQFQSAAAAGGAFVPIGTYALTSFAPGVFWAASRASTVDANNNAPIVYLDEAERQHNNIARSKQLIHSNGYLQNNFLQGVVNIGDSISHGAYSGNAYTNHWTYLMARAVIGEFGGKSIGEFPMEGLYNPIPALVTPQLADAVFVGWGSVGANPAPYNYPVGNIGSAASNSVNGKTYSSTTNGATITLTMPTMGRAITFKHTMQPGGGQFTISVNGTVKATVSTSGGLAYNVNTSNVAIEDNGKGECVVVLTKTDAAPVEINALFNLKTDAVSPTDLSGRMQFHNYAQSGRALQDMSEGAIIRACNSAALIVSLGYNDWSLGADSNDTVFAAFKQRIDWLIQYAKVYRSAVVVQDFVWYASTSSRTRQQLKRLADAVQGIYIPYPERFFSNGAAPTQSPLQLNDPMFLFADAAHPNALGNELIFSTLSAALGMACNSKTVALKYFDWAYPLKISGANLLNNGPTYPGSLTTVQQVGEEYRFRVNLKPVAATLTAGVTETAVSSLPAKFRVSPPVLINQANAAAYTYATGAARSFAIVESPATLNVYAAVAGETVCRCAFGLPEVV